MNAILPLGFLALALSFCGLSDRLKSMEGSDGGKPSGTSTGSSTSKEKADSGAEKAEMTAAQKSISEAAVETQWKDQGISFRLPSGWTKVSEDKNSFNHGTPATGFVIASISPMGPDFPADVSLKAYFEQATQKLQTGDYLSVRYLSIDGIKGVEFVEAPPSDKDSPRRHQWIAYRSYLGQTQMVNVMVTTRGGNWEGKADTFAAVLYSMKFTK